MLIQSQPVSAFEGCPGGFFCSPTSHFFCLALNVVVPMESGCGIHDLPRFCNKIWHANNIVYRSVIYRSVCPSPSFISSSLYPRLKNKWAIEAPETSRRNWVNMYAKRTACICVAKPWIRVSPSPILITYTWLEGVSKASPHSLLLQWMSAVIITDECWEVRAQGRASKQSGTSK